VAAALVSSAGPPLDPRANLADSKSLCSSCLGESVGIRQTSLNPYGRRCLKSLIGAAPRTEPQVLTDGAVGQVAFQIRTYSD